MLTPPFTFGPLLKYLRKHAGMTQRDLAAALGYSESLICNLEKATRQPDLQAVATHFIPALGLQDDPDTAAYLIEQAALARGERPPVSVTFQRTIQVTTQAAPVAALPSPPTELIGRAAEVNQLCNRLLGHSGRLLTLLGPPGVGKTRLGLEVAGRLQQSFRDGARVVSLSTVRDPLLIAVGIAALLAPGDTSSKPPQVRVIELLRHQATLLLLDNLEQIQGAASLIATLLTECPTVTILATSRERLHLRAEQRFKVQPLELSAAVELFVQRAQAVDSAFCLTDDNRVAVAAICTRLDCLPLALELCAAQVELFAPAQLLVQLQARPFDLLVDGAHDLPPQHRTLRSAIQRSYSLLSLEEQTLLRRLGVFAGGFDLVAVEAIADVQSPVNLLSSLIGKSLVRAETLPNGEQRFSLLETIREFALEQIRAYDEEGWLRHRHYEAYLDLFRTVDSHLRGPEALLWFVRVQPEYDNLRAAVQWSIAQARYADAAWLMVATNWYCRLRGQWYEELGWFQVLLPYRHLFFSELRLAFLICFASFARSPEDFATINRYADELKALAEDCTNNVLRAAVWHFLAKVTPDFAGAASAWEMALVFGRAAGSSPGLDTKFGIVADHLIVLGGVLDFYANRLIEQGLYAQATPLIQDALALCKTRGFQSGVAAALGNLGLLALLQGDIVQSRARLQEAVTITTTFPAILAKAKTLLALVTIYHNDPIEAHRLLLECLALWSNIRDVPYLAVVSIYLAETALWVGNIADAEQWLGQGLDYQVDPRWLGSAKVNCLLVAARLATARQHYQHAATLFGLVEETRIHAHYTLVAPVRLQINRALATVREALEPAVFAEAFAAGQQMALEEAFATILASP